MIFDYTKYLKFDAYNGEGFETHNRELILVKRFELINYNRFINMLKSEPKKIQQTWEKIKTLDKLDEEEHYGLGYLG